VLGIKHEKEQRLFEAGGVPTKASQRYFLALDGSMKERVLKSRGECARCISRIELRPRVHTAEAELSRREVSRWDTDRMAEGTG